MQPQLYAVLSLAVRYILLALMLVIVLRAWRMTVVDSRRAKRLREWSAESGCVGQWIIDNGRGKNRDALPIPREGVLGRSRRADSCLRIRGRAIRPMHFAFEYRPGGLLVKPMPHAQVLLNGQYAGQSLFVRDGDRLQLGDVRLVLSLFEPVQGEDAQDEAFWADEPIQDAAAKGAAPEHSRLSDELQAFEDALWPDERTPRR